LGLELLVESWRPLNFLNLSPVLCWDDFAAHEAMEVLVLVVELEHFDMTRVSFWDNFELRGSFEDALKTCATVQDQNFVDSFLPYTQGVQDTVH
jgi:hypothetical protein